MKEMAKMLGGHALVQALEAEGVRHVFGVPGAGQYEAIDGFYGRDGISYVSCRSEQPTTYMCDGYGRVGDRLAAAIVLPGEGLYNASTGMATASVTSSPMVVISGSPGGKLAARGAGRQVEGVSKWQKRIDRAADIPHIVREAVKSARGGRPQPVFIEIDHAVLAAVEEVAFLEPEARLAAVAPRADDAQSAGAARPPATGVEQAVRILRDAARPLLVAGTGVQRAASTHTLQRLAERLQAPVLTSNTAKGVIDERHPLALGIVNGGYAPLRELVGQSDAVLFLGTSLSSAALGIHAGQTTIRVDIEQDRLDADAAEVAILGDAGEVLHQLFEAIGPGEAKMSREPDVAKLVEKRYGSEEQLEPQRSFTEAIRSALPDEGIFVHDMTQLGYYSRNYFPVHAPNAYQVPKGNLGAAFPIAIGAKVAQPDRPVVAVMGDGGILYHIQELATLTLHGIGVVTVVFTDNAYGNVMRSQIEDYDNHVTGVQLTNPDFVKLAEAFDVSGARATGADQLRREVARAIEADKPALIEVPVGEMERRY
jgi:acetolactate synthase-1/2/3 large subunit